MNIEMNGTQMIKKPAQLTAFIAFIFLLAGCHSGGPSPITDARSSGGLAYDLIGEGPVVVLIHGTNLDRRMWEDEVPWLKHHARVLRYDLRGQGESDHPTQAYANHSDLLRLLDEIGVKEVSLVGLSAGAQVALDVALAAPQRVQHLVLVSPSLSGYVPKEMPPFFADLGAALRAQNFDQANEVLLASPIMSVPPAFTDHVRTMVEENSRLWTIPYSLIEQVSPPAIERLEKIQIQTLILVGEKDLEAVLAQGKLLKQRLPDAQLVTVAGGGHLLNMTSPVAFRRAVSGFLRFSEK